MEDLTVNRKTRDCWRLMVRYPGPHGEEHEITEYSRTEARARLAEYRENCPQYPARLVRGRECIELRDT
jgi:hypothetical protein